MSTFVLASQSPRRKQLLEWAEIDFEIIVHPTDESYPDGLEPVAVAEYIAQEKAAAVSSSHQTKTVIAADTIVVLDKEIIGKPKDREDALQILTKLSGKKHQVITGVCIRRGAQETLFSDVTSVQFHSLSAEQIQFYVDKYKPYDKAGAYAIQEWIGVIGIKSIQGDFYNVMGLPVSRVVQALRDFA
ncbi:MAG: maf [Flaviaesturariibacter sp.]|nr:maf [Flaviaesturariibacter sp.]